MSDYFIKMINNIDFSYGFIYECADLVNNLYDHYNYDHLAIKSYRNFVLSIINITKDEHIKEYNEHVKNSKYINRNCSYLMDICCERYFELSKDEYSEFCEKYNYILRKITVSYFNVEYIKFFYLLQKVTKLGIRKINSHILVNMFINLYNNSNIDCNEKVKSKMNEYNE